MPTSTSNTTETLTELLSHLVRMPTVSTDHATNRAALDWVQAQLDGLPLHVKRLEHNGVPSLIATTPAVKDYKQPKLWLAAHMDVVAGRPEDFEPQVRNSRLYGRGAHDMKFAIAAYMALFHELGATLANYDLGLMITCDEEIAGENGAGWLVNDLGFRGEVVFLPDSSTAWKFGLGGKGILQLRLDATGRQAHGSRPWQGVNAIDCTTGFIDHLRTNVPAEPCNDASHMHPTITLSSIMAQASVNQVPDTATATLDIRYTNDQSLGEVKGWVEDAHQKEPNVTPVILNSSLPYHVSPNHPVVRLFKTLARGLTGHDIPDHLAHGSSDGRWFAWKGVIDINVGITGSGYHTSPEWVDIKDLSRFYEVTRRFVTQFAGPGAGK